MDDTTVDTTTFNDKTDITEQLLQRYGKSSASQHRHLCATSAATRSIILSESLPLTPLSYFAATISTLSDAGSKTLDTNALSALSSLLSLVLPLVPKEAIASGNAAEGISALVEVLELKGKNDEMILGTSSARALVKCLGVLLGFCDSLNWDSVKFGFETLLKYSIDKRPKVRKCAQDCLLTVFKSFGSSSLSKKASTLVSSLLKDHIPLAVKLNSSKPSKESKDEHQEVLHVLNLVKLVVPYLTTKACSKILLQLLNLMTSKFSPMTRHNFDIIGVIIDSSNPEVITSNAENIVKLLVSFISMGEKNPDDTIIFAANLAKSTIEKLHTSETSDWINHLSIIISSIAGLLTCKASTIALQASNTMKELITHHIDTKDIMINENQASDDVAIFNSNVSLVKSTCSIFENLLSTSEVPNEHVLAVLSVLFLKLGSISDIYMKDIVLKLAGFITAPSENGPDTEHLQKCIGSVIIAMGPEKLLPLLPISLAEDLSCTNTWLIPLLRSYIVGSSLGFYIHHIIPLAESFQQATFKVKKSKKKRDLQAHANALWGLLPAFCRYPSDIYDFEALVKILTPFLKKDSFMLDNISLALQDLVKQNRSLPSTNQDQSLTKISEIEDSGVDFKSKFSHSIEITSKNLKALESCSEELLKALTDLFFDTSPQGRENLKDAIQCVASITNSSVTKKIFISSLERFQLISDFSESEKMELNINSTAIEEENTENSNTKDAERCLILELASSLVEGADENLVNLLFSFTKKVLEATYGISHTEAYQTLSKLLEKNSEFCSSKFVEIVDLLLDVNTPSDISSIQSCLTCYEPLLIHAIKGNLDEENTKAFLILNQIILMLKDSTEEGRKAAYDALIRISTSLRDPSPDGPYHKLITMIMGYLSGSSPHVKSGAVSALSVLVYSDLDICLTVPDLVTSVLELLQLKVVEVIKAVLGFVKVLVSSIQAKELNNIAGEIVNGIIPWSSMSRNHFRSKVTIILEIMMRKCGSSVIKELVPEKYKNFINSISQSRHGKATSTEEEAQESDLSSKRDEKKTKHTEFTVSTKEKGSWKRKRDDKGSFGKGVKRGEGDKFKQNGRRDNKSNRWGSSGGKRKERSESINKKNMFGKKRQKTSQ